MDVRDDLFLPAWHPHRAAYGTIAGSVNLDTNVLVHAHTRGGRQGQTHLLVYRAMSTIYRSNHSTLNSQQRRTAGECAR